MVCWRYQSTRNRRLKKNLKNVYTRTKIFQEWNKTIWQAKSRLFHDFAPIHHFIQYSDPCATGTVSWYKYLLNHAWRLLFSFVCSVDSFLSLNPAILKQINVYFSSFLNYEQISTYINAAALICEWENFFSKGFIFQFRKVASLWQKWNKNVTVTAMLYSLGHPVCTPVIAQLTDKDS